MNQNKLIFLIGFIFLFTTFFNLSRKNELENDSENYKKIYLDLENQKMYAQIITIEFDFLSNVVKNLYFENHL